MKCFIAVSTIFAIISTSHSVTLQNGNVTLDFNITTNDGIFLNLIRDGVIKLSGHIGAGISLQFTESTSRFIAPYSDVQFAINNAIDGFNIFWQSVETNRTFQDCFGLGESDWFIGKEGNPTEWPVQNSVIADSAYVVSDSSSIAEAYWLSSAGSFIFVNETVPLFVDQNNLEQNTLCLTARIEEPYLGRNKVVLNYTIAANDNATAAHRNAVDNFLGRPTGQPELGMIREPVWSTWLKYQDDISDQLLTDFSESIHSNDLRGQIQIEDGWEECHGSLTVKKLALAAFNATVISIHNNAQRATLWIHPFVDTDCEDAAQIGLANGYFVKGDDGAEITVSFWETSTSYLIDFTNVMAQHWFEERVGLLLEKHDLDGFKFDSGEASWASSRARLQGDPDRIPNELTQMYNSFSNFTRFVHVHSGWRTQWLPVFVSIPEKEPNWSAENGLKSILINIFQLNLAGYPMAIPGLIGGRNILDRPSPELFIRWTQAVTFMPVMQFGFLPWEIISPSFDVLAIIQAALDLHYWYSDGINNIIKKSQYQGLPVNPPIWWVDPTNPDAFKILDQYMLGENIMIAPVLDEGAVSRDVYLPPGQWRDGSNGTIYNGSTTLIDYPAPLDVLPYFERA